MSCSHFRAQNFQYLVGAVNPLFVDEFLHDKCERKFDLSFVMSGNVLSWSEGHIGQFEVRGYRENHHRNSDQGQCQQ